MPRLVYYLFHFNYFIFYFYFYFLFLLFLLSYIEIDIAIDTYIEKEIDRKTSILFPSSDTLFVCSSPSFLSFSSLFLPPVLSIWSPCPVMKVLRVLRGFYKQEAFKKASRTFNKNIRTLYYY